MVAAACCFDPLCQTCTHRHMGLWLWQRQLWCSKTPKEGLSPEAEESISLSTSLSPSCSLSGVAAVACLITSNLSSNKGTPYTLTLTLPAGNYTRANHLLCSVRHRAPGSTDSFPTRCTQSMFWSFLPLHTSNLCSNKAKWQKLKQWSCFFFLFLMRVWDRKQCGISEKRQRHKTFFEDIVQPWVVKAFLYCSTEQWECLL